MNTNTLGEKKNKSIVTITFCNDGCMSERVVTGVLLEVLCKPGEVGVAHRVADALQVHGVGYHELYRMIYPLLVDVVVVIHPPFPFEYHRDIACRLVKMGGNADEG